MHPLERSSAKSLDGSASVSSSSLSSSSLEPLMSDVRQVIGDAEALLKATAQQGGAELDDLRAKSRESLRAINARLATAQQAVYTQTKHAALATDRYVHDNPWVSIGVGTGLGVVVGLLLRRR